MGKISVSEDRGYARFRCRQHGQFWSDSGPVCPSCPEPEQAFLRPACSWCGDQIQGRALTAMNGDQFHPHCGDESVADAASENVAWRQVHESTDEQLLERMLDLRRRYRRGFTQPVLHELHLIESELFCREHDLLSVPGTIRIGELQCSR